ncbi:PopZ family protein [Hoeflea sp.]|uniref:PopZ family protein n=1 Tax=Hoeflea sp. TaxID=1940281 RepID=UPI00374870CE
MGQAGAQREPSMEEILASIRRIIENNEPADAVAADQDHRYEEADAHEVMQHDSQEDVSEEQAVTEDYTGDEDEPQPYESDPAAVDRAADESASGGPSISLADVAARVRTAPDAVAANQVVERVPERNDIPNSGVTIPTPVNDDLAAKIDDAVAEELRQALVSDDPVDAAPREIPAAGHQKVSEVSTAHAAGEKTRADDLNGGDLSGQDGQLVSLHTGEKVAAAFGELSTAIAAGQTRSFDEIAEEMLRPMLSQWLDDNLPTLVERLVREEIERVSRGNRG